MERSNDVFLHALLRAVDAKVEGASQRIQEDAMNFAKIVESLGLQIVRAIMLLIAFLPILWGLSSNVVIPFFKDISGSLVWVSLVASLGGLIISWIVGIKLPGLEYNNQKVEAVFRKRISIWRRRQKKLCSGSNYFAIVYRYKIQLPQAFSYIMDILIFG